MTTKPGNVAAQAAEAWSNADVRDYLSDSALTVGAGTPTDAGAGWQLPVPHPDPIIAAGGIPDAGSLPSGELEAALGRILNDKAQEVLRYGGVLGFEGLREAMAERQAALDGMSFEADNFIIHNGGSGCLDNLCQAFIDPGDVVVVEGPSYSGTTRAIRGHMAELIEVTVEDDGISVEGVADAIQRAKSEGKRVKLVYLNPDFQNPTGTTLTEPRRAELIDLCAREQVLIVEDATYSELFFDEAPPQSIYSMANGAGVLKIGTFSKVIATGLRAGWIQASKEHIDALGRVRFDMGTSPLLLHMLAEFISSGRLDPHIRKMRPVYGEKCAALSDSLREHCEPYVRFNAPGGGFFFWFECLGATSKEVSDAAAYEGLLFPPGTNFYLNKEHEPDNHVRLAFSNASLEHLRDIGPRLRRAFQRVVD
jgi:DNA-binding transcriptional MocR family regulator